jgi:hypothetical protein
MLYWFEPVLEFDPISKCTETTERPGHFAGFVHNYRRQTDVQDLKE